MKELENDCGVLVLECDGKRWKRENLFTYVFQPSFDKINNEEWFKKLRVCHMEIHWLVPYTRIPLHNHGIRYALDDVSRRGIEDPLNLLHNQGVFKNL